MMKQARTLGDQLRKEYEQGGNFRAAKDICDTVRDKKGAAVYITLYNILGPLE